MEGSQRVILIGKSGSGKSSLANTLFGEAVFKVNHSSGSKSNFSESQTRTVNGRKLTLIDTPGIFNADRTEEEVQSEIHSCYVQSAPGPHAVLLVLLIEKFTEQEQAVVDQIQRYFTDLVFPSTTVVFTHGDQLQEDTEIQDFVRQSKGLSDLVRKCEGRCHVIDNKYWRNSEDPYRSNSFQVQQILNSIETTVEKNHGSFFANEKFQQVECEIQKVLDSIQNQNPGLSREESREQAQSVVLQNYITKQKRWRIIKKVGIFITTLSIFIVFAPRVFRHFRGGAGSKFPTDVNEESSSVMEVVQDVMAPIRSVLDYAVEAIQAVFIEKRKILPNKTLTEL